MIKMLKKCLPPHLDAQYISIRIFFMRASSVQIWTAPGIVLMTGIQMKWDEWGVEMERDI